MGIGSLMLEDKFKNSFSAGCVDDVQSGCRIELWDNEFEPTAITITMNILTCVELRNYLNSYIENYINIIDE